MWSEFLDYIFEFKKYSSYINSLQLVEVYNEGIMKMCIN